MAEQRLKYRTVVIKLGTSVLTGGTAQLDRAHMVELVRQCAALHRAGCRVVVCSSGAVAAGREHLGFPELPNTVASKQMLAAVGQSHLIQSWELLFNIYGLHVGQLLLTRKDFDDRERFLNSRDTLQTLLNARIVPVINENDAVATAEIKVGDNDNLSAMVATLAEADCLMLLTDQKGLFDSDPRTNPGAQLIPEVRTIDETLKKIAGDSVSGLGTGGMATKLQAADVARRGGCDVVIASGHHPDVVSRIAFGEPVGTRFPALETPLGQRKQWIFAGPPPSARIIIDRGAVRAVRERGSSLLPKGIVNIEGVFDRGDAVLVEDADGKPVARGVARYSSSDLDRIKGSHSETIAELLGYAYGSVAIHRNDLVIV